MNRRVFFKGVAGLMVPAALGLQVDPEPIKRYWALDQTMAGPVRDADFYMNHPVEWMQDYGFTTRTDYNLLHGGYNFGTISYVTTPGKTQKLFSGISQVPEWCQYAVLDESGTLIRPGDTFESATVSIYMMDADA